MSSQILGDIFSNLAVRKFVLTVQNISFHVAITYNTQAQRPITIGYTGTYAKKKKRPEQTHQSKAFSNTTVLTSNGHIG
jgi:hypothetical protein